MKLVRSLPVLRTDHLRGPAQSVSPRELPREPHLPPRGTPRPVSSPRPEMLRDEEGRGSRVAADADVGGSICEKRTRSLEPGVVRVSFMNFRYMMIYDILQVSNYILKRRGL